MTEATDLMEGHLIQRERVPGSAIQTRQVLYFRGEKVIKLLQERNAHLQEISDRLAKVLARHKERSATTRHLIAVLVATEGCGCCGDSERHDAALAELAKMLDVPPYDDGSGHKWYDYAKKEESNGD